MVILGGGGVSYERGTPVRRPQLRLHHFRGGLGHSRSGHGNKTVIYLYKIVIYLGPGISWRILGRILAPLPPYAPTVLPTVGPVDARKRRLPPCSRPQVVVFHGIIKGKGLQCPGTNFVDKTLKPPESTFKTTFLVLSSIWFRICTRAWIPFPLIIPWKTVKVLLFGVTSHVGIAGATLHNHVH